MAMHVDVKNFSSALARLALFNHGSCEGDSKTRYLYKYIGRLYKGMTTSLALRTERPNKKQKEGISITDINNQDFRELLK